MESLQKDISNNKPVPTNIQEETHFEDEINLIDYFRVVWKRKFSILLCSILPALIVGLILFFGPRDYKVTYVYDVRDRSVYDVRDRSAYDVKDQSPYDVSNRNLDEKNYTMLLARFYSAENTDKIESELQGNGLDRYAKLMSRAKRREDLENLIRFEVSPSYMDLSKARITDPAKLEQIGQLKAQLLNMTIVARPKSDISKVSLVIRDNFENVVPLCSIEQGLIRAAGECRAKMADIEESRFSLELALETSKLVLAKLKNMGVESMEEGKGNIALQFDISGKTEYLPVGYQIQAAESKIAALEANMVENEGKYKHYNSLLSLNRKLSAELKKNVSSYYTIRQFLSFLTDAVRDSKDKELIDYLSAYIKKIENKISASAPVTEKPRVYAVPKGTAKKSAIVFVVALMMSVFISFLLEGLKKSQAQTS